MKKVLLSILFAFLGTICLNAQSAEKISEILKSKKVTFGQASYLAAAGVGLVEDDESYAAAFEKIENNGLISLKQSVDKPVPLKEYCRLCMKTAGIKGGIFYTLTKSPRYAFKELQAKQILPPYADPDFTLNGYEAIAIMNACMELSEGGN